MAKEPIKAYRPLKDEELFSLYLQGDIIAFDHFYERLSPKVWGFIRKRADSVTFAEEVFQEVWIKVHRSRDQYDIKFPIAPWIFTIARSVLLDNLRTVSRKKELILETEELTRKVDEAAKLKAETSDESQSDFIDALTTRMNEELSTEQKKLLDLRYMNEWSFYDIATSLGLSEDNVRQKISRAVKKLRRRLVS